MIQITKEESNREFDKKVGIINKIVSESLTNLSMSEIVRVFSMGISRMSISLGKQKKDGFSNSRKTHPLKYIYYQVKYLYKIFLLEVLLDIKFYTEDDAFNHREGKFKDYLYLHFTRRSNQYIDLKSVVI